MASMSFPANGLRGEDQARVVMPLPQKKRKRAEEKADDLQESGLEDADIGDEGILLEPASDIDHVPPRPSKKVKTTNEAVSNDDVPIEDETKPPKPKRPPPSDTDISLLLTGIANLPSTSWTHPTIPPAYCLIIKWFDADGLDVHTIASRYGNLVDPKTNKARELKGAGVDKGIYKHYARYGPMFYEAKGLPWATKRERNAYLSRVRKESGVGNAVRVDEMGRGIYATTPGSKPVSGAPEGYTAAGGACGGRGGRGGGHGGSRGGRAQVSTSDSSESPPRGRSAAQKSRGRGRTKVVPSNKSRSPSPRENALDSKIRQLFARTFTTKKPQLTIRIREDKPEPPTDKGPTEENLARYHQNRNSKDLLHFKREPGDALLGDPSRPVVDRQAAARASYPLEEILENNPTLRVIEYAGVSQRTVKRFVACVSPIQRYTLPTHDIVEVAENGAPALYAEPIQWSMHQLVELYRLAMDLGADYICDMVLDRWFEELKSPEGRKVWNKDGEAEMFDILDIGPEFLNHLWEKGDNAPFESHGEKERNNGDGDVALDFFTDLLVMKKREGWEVLDKYGVLTTHEEYDEKAKKIKTNEARRTKWGQFSWEKKVKEKLLEKLEKKEVDLLKNDADSFCRRFHHHHHNGGECYKTQGLGEEGSTTGTSSATTPGKGPSNPRKLDPVAIYWKHQAELFEEKQARDAEANFRPSQLVKRKPNNASYDEEEGDTRPPAFEIDERAYDRREEQKALKAEEEAMDAITISILRRPHMAKRSVDKLFDGRTSEMPPVTPVRGPVITYPDQLGNGKYDLSWQSDGKLQALKSKLKAFEDAGYQLGHLGRRYTEGDQGVEDGDDDEEGKDQDEEDRGDDLEAED